MTTTIPLKKYGSIISCLLVLVLFAGLVQAQESTHQLPYRGRLDLNGEPQDGNFDFILEIRDAADAVVWSEEFTGVGVVKGDFSVTLGLDTAGNPLQDSIWQNDELYIAVQVKIPEESEYTMLNGRQRILAVPYSARSQTAKDYRVTGELVVDGNTTLAATSIDGAANIGGLLTVGAAVVNSSINVNGSLQVDGQNPFMWKRYYDGQDALSYNTSVNFDDWMAIVAGFSADWGDIYEDGNRPIVIRCRMVKCSTTNTWCIEKEFASHNNHEKWTVDVLFIRKKLMTFLP